MRAGGVPLEEVNRTDSPPLRIEGGKCSYQADNGVGTVEVYKKRINLPKIGWVWMREELRFTGEVSRLWCPSVTIAGSFLYWYGVIESNYTRQPTLFDDKQPIGIDVGINTLATCSEW